MADNSTENRAPPQGGILEGGNPSHYDPKNPIVIFIIQVIPGSGYALGYRSPQAIGLHHHRTLSVAPLATV
jgi:hypothetical protein